MSVEFRRRLASELRARDLLGSAASRAACAERARLAGDAVLTEIEAIVGPRAARRSLGTRRGPEFANTYRYVAGYGALMTDFLSAPVALADADRARVARLGAFANVIVSHFDELVDGGWPRATLLPRWALALSCRASGRAPLRAASRISPAQPRLVVRLVVEYFAGVASLPFARRHRAAHRELRRAVAAMYEEEALTPRELRRNRGSATRQKKTALPLVVLGLAAWLASPRCDACAYARHRRWLVRLGKFIRWVDDGVDSPDDAAAGAANLVAQALRRGSPHVTVDALAAGIASRGRRVVDEWRLLCGATEGAGGAAGADVLETVLAAWVGEP